jgi:glutathione peroxidase
MIINRRSLLFSSAAMLAGSKKAFAFGTAYDFAFETIDGQPLPLEQFRGRVLMIVNTASQCAFTSQYGGLQKLWSAHRDRGLTVIGVPSNDFGGQEPGDNTEIMGFCSSTFGVTFPLAAKVGVLGEAAHPFYRWAAGQQAKAVPRWNFHKLLIDRKGGLAKTFPSSVEPQSGEIALALELLLLAAA